MKPTWKKSLWEHDLWCNRPAQKANEGQLTPEERADYDRFLEAYHFVTILQAKAREYLRRQTAS